MQLARLQASGCCTDLVSPARPTRVGRRSSRRCCQWRTTAVNEDRHQGPAEKPENLAQPLPSIGQGGLASTAEARSKFGGRLAVIALAAVLLGERITGQGAVQQLEVSATNVPLWLMTGQVLASVILCYLARALTVRTAVQEMEPALGFLVLGLVVAGLYPGKPRRQEPQPAAVKFQPGAYWQRLQRLSGRAACLGLAATITAEVITGKGALALLNIETGVEALTEIEIVLTFLGLLVLTEDISNSKAR